jgi:hypothetical protein
MKLIVSPGRNQNLQSWSRMFLVRAMMVLITFAIGYSSVIFSQNLCHFPGTRKAASTVNMIQLDGPFKAELMRPIDPPLILNKRTGQWEVAKPEAQNSLTEGPPAPPPPLVRPIEKK